MTVTQQHGAFLVVTCAIMAGAASLGAQIPAPGNGSFFTRYEKQGTRISVSLPSGSSVLKWTRLVDGVLPPATLTVPFDIPGDVCYVGDDTVIISGIHVTEASPPAVEACDMMLLKLDENSNTITIKQQSQFANLNICQLRYNPIDDIVYAYDSQGSQLMAFRLGVPNPQLPANALAFSVCATSSEIPILARERRKRLLVPPGPGVTVANFVVEAPISSYSVLPAGTGWAIQPNVKPGASGMHWSYRESLPSAYGVFHVEGGTGAFSIRLVGDVSPTYSGSAIESPFAIDASSIPGGLVPGGAYALEVGGALQSTSIFNGTWGVPLDSPRITFQRDATQGVWVGNVDFRVSGRALWVDSASSSDEVVAVYCGVAVRDPQANPVIEDGQGHAVIAAVDQLFGPITTSMGEGTRGALSVSVPIPNDVVFDGVELLFQWAVLDGASICLSEVYSSLVFSGPSTAMSATSASQSEGGAFRRLTDQEAGAAAAAWRARISAEERVRARRWSEVTARFQSR